MAAAAHARRTMPQSMKLAALAALRARRAGAAAIAKANADRDANVLRQQQMLRRRNAADSLVFRGRRQRALLRAPPV